VENALLFVDALAPDVSFERALEIYVREMAIPDPAAGVVVTRALVALGEGLVPSRAAAIASPSTGPVLESAARDFPVRPQLRLDDAAAARRRPA
jgi:hypothetical protein